MIALKNTIRILFAFVLILIVNVGLASTNGNENKSNNQEQEQDGRRKANQGMLRPDGEVGEISSPQTSKFQEESNSNPKVREVNYQTQNRSQPEGIKDTVEDDSVSKYNFIFYFLYKFKYEEEAP
jgi:hypothetical protein